MQTTATGAPPDLPNVIGGRAEAPASGESFLDIDPATGETLARVAQSSEEDVERAVQAARAALPARRVVPAPHRGEILFRAGRMLIERKEYLAHWMTREMGKVLAESRGDVQEGIDMTFFVAGEGRRLTGKTVPSELPDKWAMSVREPVGVVAAVTPWNFPLAIPAWKLMPALIAGNTVVFKPASDTPIMAYELVRILHEAGVPEGVVNLVFGPGNSVGESLCRHPAVDLVSFTGSTEAGRKVLTQAAGGLKRTHLEMGGKNAVIVLADADLDLAVDGIIWSAFGTSGQRCTAASRIIVERSVQSDLEQKLLRRIESLRVGNGLDPETDVGPLINGRAVEKTAAYCRIGVEEGARLLAGGNPMSGGVYGNGCFFEPTLFTDVHPAMRIAQEEVFGPVTAIIPAEDLDDAIRINNETRYGLSSSIYTRNVDKAFRAIRSIDTGLVYVNAGTIGAEVHLPFGGMRGTGIGHREAGEEALDVYSEWKTVYIDYSGRLQKAQIPD